MSDKEFESLMSLILAGTVNIIMQNNNWDEDYALNRFISSKVYNKLEQEDTKVWHLSTTCLAMLFENERKGQLLWPEVM